MANIDNLKPYKKGELSSEEAKKRGSKGGKKSVESRRARKTLKEELELLLSMDDSQNKISLALIDKAIKGDIKAFEVIRDTIGEKPTEKQLISGDLAVQKIFITEKEHLETKKHIQDVINEQ